MTELNDLMADATQPEFPNEPVHIYLVDISETAEGPWHPEGLCGMKTTEDQAYQLETAFDLANNVGIDAICDQCLLGVLEVLVEVRKDNRESDS